MQIPTPVSITGTLQATGDIRTPAEISAAAVNCDDVKANSVQTNVLGATLVECGEITVRGKPVIAIRNATDKLAFGLLAHAPGALEVFQLPFENAKLGDFVYVTLSEDTSPAIFVSAYVRAADTITVRAVNLSGEVVNWAGKEHTCVLIGRV